MDFVIAIIAIIFVGSIASALLKFGLGAFLLVLQKPIAWLVFCAFLGALIPFLSAVIGLRPSIPFWSCALVAYTRVAPGLSFATNNSPFHGIKVLMNLGIGVFVVGSIVGYIVSYGESCLANGQCARFVGFLD